MKTKIGFIARLALALLVLWAGWAGLGTLVDGWQFLTSSGPEPVASRTSVAHSPASDPLSGGYWQFAGLPWGIDLTGVSTAAPPELETLVHAIGGSAGGSLIVEPRFFDALRGLAWLGAEERDLPDGRWLWTLSHGRARMALLISREDEGAMRLVSGVFARQQEARGAWTIYTLRPLPSPRPPAAGLIPDTANPYRIASRHSASGEVLLEFAEIPEADVRKWSALAAGDGSKGLHEFDRRDIAGRSVRFLCGPVRPGQRALVVATVLPDNFPSTERN